ncbi:hypothetical protein RMATCC62417_08479 [Rhizopus microsporus]|nr:hypothetical protein RMATCC62417_08479 [Rhizopus microsporus]CEI98463.1 hypothetical protein RMCBS344292_12571 [Rhizopus microsporus]
MAHFAIVESLYFQLKATNLRMLNCTSMILHMMLRDDRERNENLDNEIIENPSTLLSQCNLFARIYRHAYKILANHESSSINSEDRATSNGSTESGSSYKSIDENAFD